MTTYHYYDTYGRRVGSGDVKTLCSTDVAYPSAAPKDGREWAWIPALSEWRQIDTPPQMAPVASTRKLTRLEFMGRFTDAEQSAIYTLAQTNADAQRWLDAVRMATPDPGTDLAIDLDDPRVAAGLAEFETAGILAAGRISEILA